MTTCKECKVFYPIPEDAMDYEEGAGDCVTETVDRKGRFWTATRVMAEMDASKCIGFKTK